MKRMTEVKRSQAYLRKRKMMLMLPVLIIPFLTMGFWALGGGKGNGRSRGSRTQGLNLNLPNANLKDDKLLDKLSFYDKAAKDSAKLEEEIRNDPFYQKEKEELFPGSPINMMAEQTASKYHQSLNTSPYNAGSHKPEDEIMKKVALLQEQLNKSQDDKAQVSKSQANRLQDAEGLQTDPSLSNNMDRLENMMQNMNGTDTADPQMNQMSSMLDKILDIQHPERVKERIKERSLQHKDEVFPVCKMPTTITTSLLSTEKKNQNSEVGFYGIEKDESKDQNAVEAVVDESQVLVDGAVIKLRLANDIYVAGNLIARESFAYGICSLNGERLNVTINSIRSDASIFPVKLEVYDMDGLQGIYIPGAITRDVAKQSADNSLQLMEMTSLDPSLKAQATATGINAVKNLLSKKAKLVKVTVKAGYKVLLKQKDNS
jgi:conjugative transposon TraM protein